MGHKIENPLSLGGSNQEFEDKIKEKYKEKSEAQIMNEKYQRDLSLIQKNQEEIYIKK